MKALRVAARAATIAALLLLAAAGMQWAVPRFLPLLVGDTVFLREEFLHPATYEAGGLAIAGRTFFATKVDCTGLVREPAASGRNLLAWPGLDDPCGWTFVPHLGNKAARDRSASGGRCFRLERSEEQIFQDVRLAELSSSIDRGDVEIALAGWLRSSGGALPELLAEAFHGGEWDRTVLGSLVVRPPAPSREWQAVAGRFPLPPGTRGVRLILRRARGESGAVFFDELSLIPLRSFTAPGS